MRRSPILLLLAALFAAACGSAAEGETAEPEITLPPPIDVTTSTTTLPENVDVQPRQLLLGVSSPYDPSQTLQERVNELEREIVGQTFGAVRIYKRWDEPFPSPSEQFLTSNLRATTTVLSISTQQLDGSWIPWADIATAEPDSPIGRQITDWADWLSRWDGPPLTVTLDHEPDFYRNGGGGQPADYRNAYRRFMTELRARVPSMTTTWISVAFFFRGDGGANHGPDFYPGDDIVDILAVDGFNWADCRDDLGEWRSFPEIFADFQEWASVLHPDKPVMIAEVGSIEDDGIPDRKVAWLREAATAMENWVQLEIVIFWDNVHEDADGCDFRLDSSPQAARAFAAIAGRSVFRRWQ